MTPDFSLKGDDIAPPAFRRALVLLTLLALALRLWGLGFGLPLWRAKPEEEHMVRMALRFILGDLNPHNFVYGTFYPYLLAVLYALRLAVGMASGLFPGARGFVAEAFRDPSFCFLAGRSLSAAAGAAGVWVLGRTGEALFDRRTGAVAAAFWAAAYLPVREAHFAIADPLTAFLLQASFLGVVRIWRGRRRPADYWACGFWSGLAASSKYIGLLMAAPLLTVHFFITERGGGARIADFRDRRIACFFGALATGTLLATPYLVPEWRRFVFELAFSMEGRYGTARSSVPSCLWFFVGTAFRQGMGGMLFLAAVAGAAMLAVAQKRTVFLLSLFPVLLGLLTLRRGVPLARYALPLIPFLCLTAAYAVAALSSRVKGRPGLFMASATALLLVPSLRNVVAVDRLLGKTDSRVTVLQWMAANVPPERSVAQVSSLWGRVPLESAGVAWRTLDLKPIEQKGPLPDVLLVERYPELGLVPRDPAVEERIKESYRLAGRWEALKDGVPGRVFDSREMFYLPFAGFDGVSCPGPNWELYVRSGKGAPDLHA